MEKEDYLKKSKRQKTLYWITGGTGAGLFVTGLIMSLSEYGNGLPEGTGYNENTAKTGEILMYVGGGLVLVSIPFRFAYKKNEKLAASLSLKKRGIRYPSENVASSSAFFISLNIGLGKQ